MPPYQVSTPQVMTVTAGGTSPLPMTPITMQDIRLVAGEGKLPAWAVLDAVNAILRQRGIVA